MKKVINNIEFNERTPETIVNFILNNMYSDRYIFEYGDILTGKSWGDITTGYIGRSTGSPKIPLVIYNKRSFGGQSLLCDCIISIKEAKGKRIIYQHTL